MSTTRWTRLRAAREATPSRWFPGRAMTRTEVAQLVVEHVWRHHGVEVPFDRKYLAKIEAGQVRYPSHRYRQALREVLGARSDAELGFLSANQARVAAPLGAGGSGTGRARTRRRTGRELLDVLAERGRELRRLDRLLGGGDLYEMVSRPAPATAAQAQAAAAASTVGGELLLALAELCQLAGNVTAGAGHRGEAAHYYATGLRAAHGAGDDLLSGRLLSSLARLEAGAGGRGRPGREPVTRRRARDRPRDHAPGPPWLAETPAQAREVEESVRATLLVLARARLTGSPRAPVPQGAVERRLVAYRDLPAGDGLPGTAGEPPAAPWPQLFLSAGDRG